MKAIMLRLTIMKSLFTVLSIFNLFLPLFVPMSMGISSLFQWMIIGIHFIGLLNGLGYFNQWIPLLPWFFTRFVQVLYYVFISSKDLSWLIFGILVFIDIVFIFILLITKSRYKFERVLE